MNSFLVPRFGFEDFFPNTSSYFPKILDEDKKYIFEQDLPGYEKTEINITSKEGFLEITAKNESKDKNSKRSFNGTFSLPEGIDYTKEPEAKYEKGILQISFEKLPFEEKKSLEKQIEIK